MDDAPLPLGTVVDEDRGSLPYALIHGESLVACASWAMGEAGVQLLDFHVAWSAVQAADVPLVLHDPLCPLTPADFIASCVELAEQRDAVVVGVRPVTDTIKVVSDGYAGETLDREGLLAVASPIVLPPRVVRALAHPPGTDFAELVERLTRAFGTPAFVEAPPLARRVEYAADLPLLEALSSEQGASL